MILSRFGIEERGWLLGIVLVVLIIASIEPFEIPGAPPAGPENDIFRWFVQIPAFLAAIGLMMLRPAWFSRLMVSPAKWLGAFAVWQLGVAAFGLKPLASTVFSLGFTAYIGLGVVLVHRGGWERARGYLGFTLAFIMVASALLFLTGQSGGLRLNGIMSHPNHLGGAMGIALIVFLDRFLKGANWALLFFFLAGGLLFLTDSRTAMAGAALALLVRLSEFLPRIAVPAVLGLLLTVGILVTQTSLLDSSTETLSRSGNETELTTLTGRTDIWDISVGAIATQPVVGYGPGSTTDLFKEIKPEGVLGTFEINHAHNLWLQLGLIGGLPSIGFVTFAFLGYAIQTRGNRVRDRDAIVLAIAVFGISEPVISAEPNIFLVTLAAAVASVGVKHHVSNQDSGSRSDGKAVAVA